jgi:hypothetical protein
MRFDALTVRNFRAIRHMEISDLADVILIAGPNGCGKSVALDSVRLLKSIYGGYQFDEWRHWFSEFQIDLANRASLRRLLRDKDKPLDIAGFLRLADSEREFISSEAERLLEPVVWRQTLGRDIEVAAARAMAMSTELRVHGERVKELVDQTAAQLRSELEEERFRLAFHLTPDGQTQVANCLVAEVVFQTYEPEHIGVIDYHSAARTYAREGVGGVTLQLQGYEQQRRAHSLYNWQQKYQNVKTELASNYVQEVFTKEAGSSRTGRQADLNETLKDLFRTFFPNKTYEGPVPTADGTLEFPVRLQSGETHDIDDLSSGEKEILYGYLRLRNSAPHDSVILLDEPELHLNPGLLQGLADFYHRHLGRALNNQLWLVTHSDALLRQAVGNQNFSAFHLRTAATTETGENQGLRITADDELERAVIDLVGDLATYKPNAKVVILEGEADTEFDVRMVSRLFPQFAQRVNLVSGGGKKRVRDLYATFAEMATQARLSERFYAIVDRDSAIQGVPEEADVKHWDRYHIENYLLEPKFLLGAMRAVSSDVALPTESETKEALRQAARTVVSRLVLERLQSETNDRLVRNLEIGAPRDTDEPASDLLPSIEGSLERITETARELLDPETLAELETAYRAELEQSLETDEWLEVFPGRLILALFVDEHLTGVNYEAFRNLVLDQMVDERHAPDGIASVLAEIDPEP